MREGGDMREGGGVHVREGGDMSEGGGWWCE